MEEEPSTNGSCPDVDDLLLAEIDEVLTILTKIETYRRGEIWAINPHGSDSTFWLCKVLTETHIDSKTKATVQWLQQTGWRDNTVRPLLLILPKRQIWVTV